MVDDRARVFHFYGNLIRFLAFPDETGGRCAIVEITVAPGAGAPPNFHAGEDESFYVLEGEFEFMLEGEVTKAGPGDFIKIPDGSLHAFSCSGDTPGKLIGIDAPGHMHVALFTEVGEEMPNDTTEVPPPSGPPDMEKIMAVSSRVGMTVVVPDNAPA